jgi:hypothetical protein
MSVSACGTFLQNSSASAWFFDALLIAFFVVLIAFFVVQSSLTAIPRHATLLHMSRRESQVAVSSFGEHAEESLQFIRRTMERSATFTAVPGLGGAGMGVVGLAAAVLAASQRSAERWLMVWLLAAGVAASIGVTAMLRKAARLGAPLAGAVGRRFAMSLAARSSPGRTLTWGVWMHDGRALLPSLWLLLYGTGVLAGGVFSVAAVRLLGVAFMVLGVVALATPPAWGNLWLALGFGGLQLVFGLYIARRHGG